MKIYKAVIILLVLIVVLVSGCGKRQMDQSQMQDYSDELDVSTAVYHPGFSDDNIKLMLNQTLPQGYGALKYIKEDVDNDSYPEIAAAFKMPPDRGTAQTQISVLKWSTQHNNFYEAYTKTLNPVSSGVQKIQCADIFGLGAKNLVFTFNYDNGVKGLMILGNNHGVFSELYSNKYNVEVGIADSDKDNISEIMLVNRYLGHIQKPVVYRYFEWNGAGFKEFNRKIDYENEKGSKTKFIYPSTPEKVVENYIESYLIDLKDELEKLSINDKMRGFNLKSYFTIDKEGGLNYFSTKVASSSFGARDIVAFGSEKDNKGICFSLIKKGGKWKITGISQ